MTGALDLDAVGQAELVRTGQVGPAELVAAAIARIERRDPQLNAVVTPLFDKATDTMPPDGPSDGSPDRPFRGVPILVKDFGAPTAGDPYSAGTRLLKRLGYRAPADSDLVRRLRAAGFVILGRTNTAELGQLGTTEPLAWGPTSNPYHPGRSAGGSSGGSAAAVAAGMVAVAHGNDGLGSLRIPASACGLVGLKPGRGLVSPAPAPESLAGFATEGVLTRTVRDTAALLDVLAPGDTWYAARAGERPAVLRIGVSLAPAGADVDPVCREAVASTAASLEHAGHRVAEAEPAALAEEILPELVAVRGAASVAAQLDDWGRRLGVPITPDDVEPVTWRRAVRGRELSAARLAGALADLQLLARQLLSWWDTYDLLLCPTMAQPPLPLGVVPYLPEDPTIRFTVPANITGQPAISVPAAVTASGLPVGVQLVARPGHDLTLLQVATQLRRSPAG